MKSSAGQKASVNGERELAFQFRQRVTDLFSSMFAPSDISQLSTKQGTEFELDDLYGSVACGW